MIVYRCDDDDDNDSDDSRGDDFKHLSWNEIFPTIDLVALRLWRRETNIWNS